MADAALADQMRYTSSAMLLGRLVTDTVERRLHQLALSAARTGRRSVVSCEDMKASIMEALRLAVADLQGEGILEHAAAAVNGPSQE